MEKDYDIKVNVEVKPYPTFEEIMKDRELSDIHYVIIQHNMYLESYSRRGIVFTSREREACRYDDIDKAKEIQLKIGGAIVEVTETNTIVKKDITNEVK